MPNKEQMLAFLRYWKRQVRPKERQKIISIDEIVFGISEYIV